MEENIQYYELLYFVPGSVAEEKVPEAVAKVDEFLASVEAKIENKEELGSQKLAYQIKQEKYGYYVCITFYLAKDKLNKLNEQLRLAPEVMRFLIVKAKKKTAEDLAQEEKIQEKIQAKKKEVVKKELAAQEKKEEEAKAPAKPVEEASAPKDKISMEDLDKKLDEILDEGLDI